MPDPENSHSAISSPSSDVPDINPAIILEGAAAMVANLDIWLFIDLNIWLIKITFRFGKNVFSC